MAVLSLARKNFLTCLWSVPGIGLQSYAKILTALRHYHIKGEDFWVNKRDIWQKIPLRKNQVESIETFKKEHNLSNYYQQLLASGLQLIFREEKTFPPLLKEIPSCPPLLFIKSHLSLGQIAATWQQLPVAVVGSRKMTGYGRWLIQTLVADLVKLGATLVSGFMYGVDVSAQEQAVLLNRPSIAVLGYGFDYCYPAWQKEQLGQFLSSSAIVVSEYPPDTQPSKGSFVQRNRLIAGLSLGTLVVEAAAKSGSQLTANFANDFGRLVFTIPGPISNPYCEGTKELLKNGATPVSSAQELLRELQTDYRLSQRKLNNQPAQADDLLVNLLLEQPSLNFDQLQQLSQLSTEQLNQALFDLEVTGRIKQEAGLYCLNRVQ